MEALPPDISPAPWRFTQGGSPGWKVSDSNNNLVCFSKDNPYEAPDAEFIVWARNNIEDLLFDIVRLRSQKKRLQTQTRQIRKIYAKLQEFEQWLKDTQQPDTYIKEFEELIHERGIFRESEM
jgi:hypothetical protein